MLAGTLRVLVVDAAHVLEHLRESVVEQEAEALPEAMLSLEIAGIVIRGSQRLTHGPGLEPERLLGVHAAEWQGSRACSQGGRDLTVDRVGHRSVESVSVGSQNVVGIGQNMLAPS